MKKEIIVTDDGSHTLFIPELDETYHSRHGAIQESIHVFINAGLKFFSEKNNIKEVSILEIGFGTGLNALLTCIEAAKISKKIIYDSIEAFPLQHNRIEQLNYADILTCKEIFNKIHAVNWDSSEIISEHFTLTKISTSIQCFVHYKKYDIIFFDAFAPRVQPEMWTTEIFRQLFSMMNAGGILVTYCAKGEVKRNMKKAGFTVESIEGPPGKREMTRAAKP